jgi:subtilisin-like proprotein convertase family protein
VELTHPSGSPTVKLIQRAGAVDTTAPIEDCHLGSPFGCGGDNPNLSLDDEGANGPAESACGAPNVPAGSYTPFNPLSAFDGMDAQGNWTIRVSDNGAADTGNLTSWSLTFSGGVDNDCNNNNVPDECDVAGDTSNDCQPDGIPDECQGGSTQQATGSEAVVTVIPDNNAAGINRIINIGSAFTIADVNVSLAATHTWYGDLCITLTHPSGSPTVKLIQRAGAVDVTPPILDCHNGSPFGCSGNNPSMTLDDELGTQPAETVCGSPNVPAGTYTPFQSLNAFDGLSSAGNWTLNVSDNGSGDTGSLTSWSITITSPPDPCAPLSPDFNRDGSVDLIDFGILQACTADGASMPAGCDHVDMVTDGVIDVLDYKEFEQWIDGPQGL